MGRKSVEKIALKFCPVCCQNCSLRGNSPLIEDKTQKIHLKHLLEIIDGGIQQILYFGKEKQFKKLTSIIKRTNVELDHIHSIELLKDMMRKY